MREAPDRNSFEPFRLFGNESIIWSKEEALMVIDKSSYYIYFFGVLLLSLGLIDLYLFFSSSEFKGYLLDYGVVYFLFGLIYLTLGFLVKKRKSRIASIFSFSFISLGILDYVYYEPNEFGFWGVVAVILLMAFFRSIQGCFAYHKYLNKEKLAS